MLKNWFEASIDLGDDQILSFGTSGDGVILNRSTILDADTGLASVLIGTPESQAIAANSLMISNITASGDIGMYVNKGGASQMVFWADGSTGDTAIMAASGQSIDLYIAGSKILDISNDGTKTTILGLSGDYLRIGDAGTTASGLNSEDDLMVTGDLEVTGDAYFHGTEIHAVSVILDIEGTSSIRLANDRAIHFGSGAYDSSILYETVDADAKIMLFIIDESADAGNNVPVFAFMEDTGAYADLGLFDAFVQPLVCVVDNDKDSWCGISFSADDVPILSTNKTGANGIVITNPKNAAASALSGTQLDVEIDIGGTPYHFTVYPTKA